MKKINKMTPKGIILILALAIFIGLCAVGCSNGGGIREVLSEEEYTYVNPDESKAETDEGIVIDGVLDEEVYQNNNWLYLHNDEGNNVDIAMTSYYGEKGMYFVYDVTESVPIYVNLNRASYMNSCIEMYFAPSSVTSMGQNSVFEIDMLPTGDMVFKKSNGKGGYANVATTNDIMAYLGATTKGGEINTEDCYGYCLELFIPWDYMEWVGMDAEAMKESFVYVDPAHITSYNLTGTDTNVDRYWYFFAKQQGATFANVFQYFRFDGTGALGTVPVEVTEGENYTIEADPNVIPGVKTTITIKPENGFALNSILVNGEECIQSVSYNADGSANLVIRPGEEGLKISAAAEAVTDGTKTLSGTVRLANLEEDTLEGVLTSYKGPKGEKPLTLDENGNFRLEGLEQGYYSLEIEKEGYQSISRGIYLNRDMDVKLVLEFDTFFTQNGSAFVLDEQNNGVVHKFGGTGYIMSNQSYDKFTYEMNIRYDAELAKEADTDAFKQQRTGMRIMFSNGKYWYIDMLKQGNDYILQYAKHSNSIFNKWTTVCTLNEKQIAKYRSDEGITLKVVRDGRFAGVFLDDILLRVEKLDYEYLYHTAQLGMESWSANRGILEIPYSIYDGIRVCVAASDFYRAGNWNITGQYDGYVMLNNGGDGGWLNFGEKYVDSDVSIIVKDYPEVETKPDDFRTVIKHTFENGKTASFSIYYDKDGKYVIQSMGDSIFGWKYHYELTEEEIAKLTGDGIELRVVRIGTEISCYLDGKEIVSGADLTVDKNGKASGIKADMESTVSIRHYGDEGVPVVIPYEMEDELDYVKVTSVETEFGKVATNKDNYLRGDIVTLSDSGEGAYYPYAMKVNGETVTLDKYGNYSFVAEEDEYIVEGEFAERIFYNAAEWNEVKQNVGILTIPDADGDSNWVYSYRSDYKDFDFKTTLRDYNNADDNYRAAVRLGFANGQHVAFTITNDRRNDDATTVYELQNMGGSMHSWALPGYTLNEAQVAAIQSEAGLEFRIVRVGDVVDVYVGGEHAHEYDLSSGDVADQGAQIRMRFYGNTGRDVEVPFSITEGTPKLVTVNTQTDGYGTITVNNKNVLPDEIVNLTVQGNSGYAHDSFKINGADVVTDLYGNYSFKATEDAYDVTATFAPSIFKSSVSGWLLENQHYGQIAVSYTNKNGNSNWADFADKYTDVDITMQAREYADSAKPKYTRSAIRFMFDNGKIVTFSIAKNTISGGFKYSVQSLSGDSIGMDHDFYVMNDEQIAKFNSAEGIEFRVIRKGTKAYVYLDGVLVVEGYDLAKNLGVAADTPAALTIRRFDDPNILAVYDNFSVSENLTTVNVNVTSTAHGTVTADQDRYLPGETVTLKVTPDGGCELVTLTVDGKAVTVTGDTYTFPAGETSHTVNASFVRVYDWDPKNVAGHVWDLTNQTGGIITGYGKVNNNGEGDTGWTFTYDNVYRDITLQVSDKLDNNKFRMAVHLEFTNGKTFRISLRDKGTGYDIQTMSGNSIVGNWTSHYTLNETQAAKLLSAEGIEFRVAIVGNDAVILLDDVRVCTIDLSKGNVAGLGAKIAVRLYGNNDVQTDVAYTLGGEPETVTIYIPETANGTVTADRSSYIAGETATITVAGDAGYAHNSLTVNGQAVETDLYGKYSFVITEDTTVNATFAESIFKSTVTGWLLENQHYGQIAVSYTNSNGNSNWGDFAEQYGDVDITLTAREYADTVKPITRTAVRFTFTNKKVITFSIAKNSTSTGYKYTIQALGGDNIVGGSTDFYWMTDAQIAKFNSAEGIKFRVIRKGTKAYVYLDGVLVVDGFDLTQNSSGVTADMKANITIRRFDDPGILAVYDDFSVSTDLPKVTVNIAETANGTVTADQDSYLPGETVTLTVAGESGYYHTGLYVDGQLVNVGWDGTYSFVATKESYSVSCGFASTVFIGGDTRHWDLFNHHVGQLRVKSHSSGHSGWIDYTGTCNDVTTVVKDHVPDAKNFAMVYMFKFSGGDSFNLRMHHTDGDGVYRIQTMNGHTLFGNWKSHYSFDEEQTAAIQGNGIEYRVIVLNNAAHVYLNGVKVCVYEFNKDVSDQTVTVTLRMDGNLNNDVYMTYKLANTTELP